MAYDAILAETISIAGHDGDQIAAYLARPLQVGPCPGVVVIHHMPGWDEATKEITRRFAVHGYLAICPHLHYREGPESSSDDAAAASRAAGGVPDERLIGDVGGALRYIRAMPQSNAKVGVIGYCSGGRQALLAASALAFDAAVDCYGAFVLREAPESMRLKVQPLVERLYGLTVPVLGLFGNEDHFPAPDEVDELEALLKANGTPCEFHRYDGAGHAFFNVDRDSYRAEAAADGWRRIWDWFGRYLAT